MIIVDDMIDSGVLSHFYFLYLVLTLSLEYSYEGC